MSNISVDYDVLNQRGSPAWFSDIYANIPTAGYKGRMFISTDTYAFYRDTGTGWDLIGGPGTGTITGSGATGQVSFFNGSSTLSGNNNLFWDNTNSRLGIGTIIPGTILDVHGTANVLVQLNNTTTGNSNIAFQNQDVAKWRIGNVYNGGANSFDLYNVSSTSTIFSVNSNNTFTFSSSVFANFGIALKDVSGVNSNGNLGLGSTGAGLSLGMNVTTTNYFVLPTSVGYSYTFPATTGTLALTSNLNSYVPYTGATQNVSLGSNVVTAGSFYSSAGIFLSISGQATSGSGFATINGGSTYLDFRPNNGGIFLLSFPYSTTRTFTLPDTTGTIALTSNLSSYVPYTGATTNVDLGTFNLTSGWLFANGNGGSNSGVVSLKIGTSIQTTSGYGTIGAATGQQFVFASVLTGSYNKVAYFNLSALTDSTARVYSFPDADGTIALTSNLSSYLPLTGGTLTGQLYINPTNTATIGLDVASDTIRFRSDNLEGFKRQLNITMGSGTLIQFAATGFGGSYNTELAFYTSSTSGVNASPGIYITGNSNCVGIGTGSPVSKLTIQAPASANPNTGGLSFNLSNNTTYFTIGVNVASGDGALLAGSGGAIRFYTDSDMATTNERMRLLNTGILAINTTTSTASMNQTGILQVNGGIRSTSGLLTIFELGTIAQNTTITQAISYNGLYIITNGGNNSALFMITRAGGSRGCQLIFSTNNNLDITCGTTTEPAAANYLKLWMSATGELSIKNVNAYTGPYSMNPIASQ